MLVTIKTRTAKIEKNLTYRKCGKCSYAVHVEEQNIGTVYKADGRIKTVRHHRIVGNHITDRWFAQTVQDERLGRSFPYDEGYSSRREATIELFEVFFGVVRDPQHF